MTILRAGLPLNEGVWEVFPNAEVGFLAMSRDEETLKAKVDYVGIPNLTDRTVILTDTMLANGGSILDAIVILKQYNPKRIIVISALAAEAGIARILTFDPSIKIFAGAVDPIVDQNGFIIPGLGMPATAVTETNTSRNNSEKQHLFRMFNLVYDFYPTR